MATDPLRYRITKSESDVCSLRLDFEAFVLVGTGQQTEINGGTCARDSLTITASTGSLVPVLCGQNRGQHRKNAFGLC